MTFDAQLSLSSTAPRTSHPKISGLIVTFNRANLLRAAVVSVFCSVQNARLLDSFELLILVDEQDEESLEILRSLDFPDLSIQIEATSRPFNPASGRNRLLGLVKSEWICFLDDDIILPEAYFSRFLEKIQKSPQVAVLGGPNLNPPGSKKTPSMFGEYLASGLVTGPIAKRYGGSAIDQRGSQFNLMLCNLFIKRSLLTENPFGQDLRTCEENELFEKMAEVNSQWLSSSDLFVWHHRRATLKAGIFQIYGYGVGRGQVLSKGFRTQHAIFLMPMMLGLLTIILLISQPGFRSIIIAMLFGWCFLVWLQVSLKAKRWSLIFLPLPILIVAGYSYGIFVGYLSLAKKSFRDRIRSL